MIPHTARRLKTAFMIMMVCVPVALTYDDTIPRLQEVTYKQSRNEFNEKELSDTQVRKLYDSLGDYTPDLTGCLPTPIFLAW